MIASYAGVLVGSFFTQRFFSFGFWFVDLVLLLAIVGVVVALLTDDRDPSVLLAWLFVIVLVPVLGVVAYFFVGRNQRKETRHRGEQHSRLRQLDERGLGPVLAASRDFSKASVAALDGTPGQRVEAAGHREGGSVPVPADSVRLYFAGADKFRDLFADLRGPGAQIDLMYLIWEKDELTAEVTDSSWSGSRPGSGCTSSTTGSAAAVQEGRARPARQGRRRGRALLQATPAAELPQPHEDGLRRRRSRLLRRHEHGAGVHRRR